MFVCGPLLPQRAPRALLSSMNLMGLVCDNVCLPAPPPPTGLRYHSERHVRCLAAETLGFLLRQATPKQLRSGLRALLGEAAVRHSAARVHGAGLLAAEAVVGVEHGLHSKAPVLLQMLLQEDLLTPEDFGSAADAAAAAADSAATADPAAAAVAGGVAAAGDAAAFDAAWDAAESAAAAAAGGPVKRARRAAKGECRCV
jgi:U3 small nucleolar RNA-associated protein 20